MTGVRERLAAAPALDLPADRPHPRQRRPADGRVEARVRRGVAAGVAELARREGCTAFQAAAAAVTVLLARYTGRRDVVLGAAPAGAAITPLHVDLSGEPSFGGLLRRVRSAGDRPGDEPQPQVLVAAGRPDDRTSRFDLTFEVEEREEGWRVGLVYRTDLFERGRMERALGHLGRLLEEALGEPGRSVWELPLLTAGERAELLSLGGVCEQPVRSERCLHELFEEQASRSPEAVAVLFPALSSGESSDRELSYGELNGLANQLARHLRGRGVGPGVRVGILMERTPEMVVAQLGVLKAGGVYVPMSPENPRERLAYLVSDTAPAVVLTQERLAGELPVGTPVLCLDTGWGAVSGEASGDLPSLTTVDSQLVVIYTSGSTGAPKGTVLGGRGYVNLLRWYRERMALDAGTRFLLMLSFTFDASLKDILGTLLSGGCLVLSPTRYDPGTLAELIERYRVTALCSTPTMLYPVLELGYERLASLRCVCVGGEATHLARVRPWFESEHCRSGLLHGYGPTECSDVTAAFGPIRGRELIGLERLPIGSPLPRARVYVLDERDELQPLGVPGELCVGGELLAQGYLNRPGLTAERFAVDPFVAGQRMYRTGDVARWRGDGELELLGRVDRQVKIRGLRIELGEIESLLGEHAAVREAVVTVHEDAGGERRLVAYVVGGAAAGELREHLRGRLPEYLVPSVFVALERLPQGTSGKVDVRALPAPDLPSAHEGAGPRTTLEESLVGLWSEVLHLERVGVHDNFFALGGHSLLAAQMIAQVGDLFEVDMAMESILEAPTVAAFAERLLRDAAQRERVERVAEVLVSVSRLSDEEILGEAAR